MTNTLTPDVIRPPGPRPVLMWHPETEESHVQAGVEEVARFLNVSADAVVGAISSGELLRGWFVDWDASGAM
jgi:hypothetical protein